MSVSIASVYEKAKGYVGRTERVRLGTIRRRDFQRFATASGDDNPLFFDGDHARAAGYPGVIAPPLYLSAVMGWESGPPQESLREDGTAGGEVAALPIQGLRLMGGGQDLEFHRPVEDGAEVTMEVGAESVELKEGRSGSFMVIKILKRYFDAGGLPLTTCRETFIVR